MRPSFLVPFVVLLSACGSAPEDETSPESEDAVTIYGPGAYFMDDRASGTNCLSKVNRNTAPSCLGPLGFDFANNAEEHEQLRKGLEDLRVVVKARAGIGFNGSMSAAGYNASEAWVSQVAGPVADPIYSLRKVGNGYEAERLNVLIGGKTSLSSVDFAPSGVVMAEREGADADASNGTGVLVSGRLSGSTLAVKRIFRKFVHVVTMYEMWPYKNAPGDKLGGSVYRLLPGAQLHFILTSFPTPGTKNEVDNIVRFASSPSGLVIREELLTMTNGERNRFVTIRVPPTATAGTSWTVRAVPGPAAAGDPQFDFSFRVEASATCSRTTPVLPQDLPPGRCE